MLLNSIPLDAIAFLNPILLTKEHETIIEPQKGDNNVKSTAIYIILSLKIHLVNSPIYRLVLVTSHSSYK